MIAATHLVFEATTLFSSKRLPFLNTERTLSQSRPTVRSNASLKTHYKVLGDDKDGILYLTHYI